MVTRLSNVEIKPDTVTYVTLYAFHPVVQIKNMYYVFLYLQYVNDIHHVHR